MREKLKDPSRILHIKKAIDKIETFMKDKSLDDMRGEGVLFYAVVKNLEIIGEASNLLTEEFRTTNSFINWNDYIKLRHVLVHGYYTISPEIVFEICKNDIPDLKILLQQIE
ncbi:MAG: DUF86 domain-containing protein [Muribaculaceae bacterium]|nr:DUF86 domain-containing protein [Muribaculaceae bacterium]